MVRSENRSQIQAKKHLVDSDKDDLLPYIHEIEEHSEVHHEVESHEDRFKNRELDVVTLYHETDARKAYTQPLQHKHRKEVKCLITDKEAHNPLFPKSLLFRKRYDRNKRMRIPLEIVGVYVVFVMLVNPPAPAQTEQEANGKTDHIVPSRGFGDLAV